MHRCVDDIERVRHAGHVRHIRSVRGCDFFYNHLDGQPVNRTGDGEAVDDLAFALPLDFEGVVVLFNIWESKGAMATKQILPGLAPMLSKSPPCPLLDSMPPLVSKCPFMTFRNPRIGSGTACA